jgi:uncharacterized membrane protein YbhN (UPF0104 family)
MKYFITQSKRYLPLCVSFALVYYILTAIVPANVLQNTLKQTDGFLIIVAFLLILLSTFFLIVRWKLLLDVSGFNIPLVRLCKIYGANLPIAKFTPGFTGDFIRSIYLKNEVPVSTHTGIILFEALLDIAILCLFLIVGNLFFIQTPFVYLGISILCGIAIFLYLIHSWSHTTILSLLKKFLNIDSTLASCLSHPEKLAQIVLFNTVGTFIFLFYIFTLFNAVGGDIPLMTILTMHPIVILLTLIPISFWGIGIREGAMFALYGTLVENSEILSVGILIVAIGSITLPLLAIPFTYGTIREFMSTAPHSTKDD